MMMQASSLTCCIVATSWYTLLSDHQPASAKDGRRRDNELEVLYTSNHKLQAWPTPICVGTLALLCLSRCSKWHPY